MDELVKIVAGLIGAAYSIGIIKFAIVDFFQRQGKLHERHVQTTNEIELAEARVDAEKVIPALLDLINGVERAQETAKKNGERLDNGDALEQAKTAPMLKQIAEALASRTLIETTFDAMQQAASRIWQTALVHLATLIGAVGLFVWNHYLPAEWLLRMSIVCVTVAVIAGMGTVAAMKVYHGRERRFLKLIRGAS